MAYPVTSCTAQVAPTCWHFLYITYSLLLDVCSVYHLTRFLIIHTQFEDLGCTFLGACKFLETFWAPPGVIHGAVVCFTPRLYFLKVAQIGTDTLRRSRCAGSLSPLTNNVSREPHVMVCENYDSLSTDVDTEIQDLSHFQKSQCCWELRLRASFVWLQNWGSHAWRAAHRHWAGYQLGAVDWLDGTIKGSIKQWDSPRKSDLSSLSHHINGCTTKKPLLASLVVWELHSRKLYANRLFPLDRDCRNYSYGRTPVSTPTLQSPYSITHGLSLSPGTSCDFSLANQSWHTGPGATLSFPIAAWLSISLLIDVLGGYSQTCHARDRVFPVYHSKVNDECWNLDIFSFSASIQGSWLVCESEKLSHSHPRPPLPRPHTVLTITVHLRVGPFH